MAKKLPEGWRTSYCTLIAEGYTHKDAADAVGVAPGTVRRHLQEDAELRELYAEARETVRDKVRNRIWQMGMLQSKDEVDSATTRWALDHLVKWNLPEARDTQRLDVNVGGSVEISHEARLTLDHVVALATQLGLSTGARGELPVASEILAEPGEG